MSEKNRVEKMNRLLSELLDNYKFDSDNSVKHLKRVHTIDW